MAGAAGRNVRAHAGWHAGTVDGCEEWEAGDGLTTRLGATHCRVLANARERRRVAHSADLHQTSQRLPQPAAALYPIDTIKTRLQAMRSGGGISALLKVQREGRWMHMQAGSTVVAHAPRKPWVAGHN